MFFHMLCFDLILFFNWWKLAFISITMNLAQSLALTLLELVITDSMTAAGRLICFDTTLHEIGHLIPLPTHIRLIPDFASLPMVHSSSWLSSSG